VQSEAATRLQELRRLIDAERRRRIRWDSEARCAGCAVELIDPDSGEQRYVAGCRTCADRRCKHRARERAASNG
jgi:hypothetical protein